MAKALTRSGGGVLSPFFSLAKACCIFPTTGMSCPAKRSKPTCISRAIPKEGMTEAAMDTTDPLRCHFHSPTRFSSWSKSSRERQNTSVSTMPLDYHQACLSNPDEDCPIDTKSGGNRTSRRAKRARLLRNRLRC
jgi:hypothetical protein